MIESYFYFAATGVYDVDGFHLQVIGIYCTKEEFEEHTKSKKMTRDLIPRFFFEEYVRAKSSRPDKEEILKRILGDGEMPFESKSSIVKTSEGEYHLFISVNHVKDKLMELGIDYNEFVDGYAKFLKNLTLPLAEILSTP